MSADVRDETADTVDVVSEGEAAKGFDQDEADGFLIGRGNYVAESHRQHYVRAPIIRPNVPFDPRRIADALRDHPIHVFVEVGHGHEQNRQNVREAKV